jgi:hypothetical protein
VKIAGTKLRENKLEGMIEFDEGFFVTETDKKDRESLKRGRGNQKQGNVSVMTKSTPLEDITTTGKISKHCRYFKMKVLQNHYAEDIKQWIESSINEKSIVFYVKSTSYIGIADYVDVHVILKSSHETTTNTHL